MEKAKSFRSVWFAAVAAALSAALGAGCASAPESPYRNPGEARGRTTDFTTYDFQQCATALTDSLLGNAALERRIKAQFADKTPLVAIRLENLTYQHAATDKLKEAMLGSMQKRLLDSERFDFVDRKAERLIADDAIDEIDGVIVADGEAAELKNARGADYILAGELEEFREGDGRVHDTYYKMTMKLHNKHTKKVDWIGEKEIRKVSTRPVVGW